MNQYDLSISNLIGKLPINLLPKIINSISYLNSNTRELCMLNNYK